jgi:dUTP pyrophosphatase
MIFGRLFTKEIGVVKLHPDAKLPTRASEEAAGWDVSYCGKEKLLLPPSSTEVVGTGISLVIPKGYHVEVRSRSGLAAKNSVSVLNSPGTIDSDYTGELKVILRNNSNSIFEIKNGDRIAQILLRKNVRTNFKIVEKHRKTTRGSGGFGSTGK